MQNGSVDVAGGKNGSLDVALGRVIRCGSGTDGSLIWLWEEWVIRCGCLRNESLDVVMGGMGC